jgi:hypothetical protein
LKNEREMVRKKAEILKEPKDVQTWREKAAVVRREIVSSKKQAFQNFLKNLDYRKDTSKVHKFISTLNDKCNINNREPLNSKNSIEYKDKEIAKAFTSFYIFALYGIESLGTHNHLWSTVKLVTLKILTPLKCEHWMRRIGECLKFRNFLPGFSYQKTKNQNFIKFTVKILPLSY